MLDTPNGVADALHGSTSPAKIFLAQYSVPRSLCDDPHLDQRDHKPTTIEFTNDSSSRIEAAHDAPELPAGSPRAHAPVRPSISPGNNDALHGPTSPAKISIAPYSVPKSLCDDTHLDQRDHKPTTIEFTDHAAARRIACFATPPSRDAPPTPNRYHPS